jgi:hypothetical protein
MLMGLLIASVMPRLHAQASAPPAAKLSYDDYCRKAVPEKRAVFATFTPAQRIAMARTQLERWREMHRKRLTSTQLALIEEWITVALPLDFNRPRPADARPRLRALEERLVAVFTEAELEAMEEHGPCLPKPSVSNR